MLSVYQHNQERNKETITMEASTMTAKKTTTREVTFTHEIVPTPEDAGLQMTITVKAYDTGMVVGADRTADGHPVNDRIINNARDGYDAGHGWLGAAEHIMLKLGELRRQAVARQRSGAGVLDARLPMLGVII